MALDALLCWSEGHRPRVVPSACLSVQRAVAGVGVSAVRWQVPDRRHLNIARVHRRDDRGHHVAVYAGWWSEQGEKSTAGVDQATGVAWRKMQRWRDTKTDHRVAPPQVLLREVGQCELALAIGIREFVVRHVIDS